MLAAGEPRHERHSTMTFAPCEHEVAKKGAKTRAVAFHLQGTEHELAVKEDVEEGVDAKHDVEYKLEGKG